MADDTSHVLKTLDDLRRQALAKLEAARNDVMGMNAIEMSFSLPVTQLGDLLSGMGASPTASPSSLLAPNSQGQQRRGMTALRPDEYLGADPMEAAKKYMRGVGHAVDFDEIADAVKRGGAAVKGADWRDRLELSLKRSPFQVITVGEKTYGLREFYTDEQMKGLRSARRGDDSNATAKKKKLKAKGNARAKAAKAAADDSPTKAKKTTKGKSTKEDVASSEPVH